MNIWKVVALLETGYLFGNCNFRHRFTSYRHSQAMGIRETLSDIICRKLNYIFLGREDPYSVCNPDRPWRYDYSGYVNRNLARSIRTDDIPDSDENSDDTETDN